jgi:hypothetical protein
MAQKLATHEVPLGELIVGLAQLFVVLAVIREAKNEFQPVPCLLVVSARAKILTINAPVSVIKAGQASPVGIQGHHFGKLRETLAHRDGRRGDAFFAQVFEKKPILILLAGGKPGNRPGGGFSAYDMKHF